MEKSYQLPKDFGTRWVIALRSGEYKQTTGTYYDGKTDCYCMLGVGFKVNGVEFDANGSPDTLILHTISEALYDDILRMNDRDKKSFIEGADFIEQNVEFI